MRLTVIAVGGLKEKFFREAAAEYQKRLSAYAKLEILEIAEARLRGESGAEIARALEEEGGRILQKIGPRAYVTALCVEGRQMGSVEFSEKLAEVTASGRSELVFVIGGSHGLSDAVKNNKDILSTYVVFDTAQERITVGETDVGRALQNDIDDLTALLDAYRDGTVKEK